MPIVPFQVWMELYESSHNPTHYSVLMALPAVDRCCRLRLDLINNNSSCFPVFKSTAREEVTQCDRWHTAGPWSLSALSERWGEGEGALCRHQITGVVMLVRWPRNWTFDVVTHSLFFYRLLLPKINLIRKNNFKKHGDRGINYDYLQLWK